MNDLASSFEDAWESFQVRDSLRLAGDALEVEWTRGRAQYLAVLARIEDAAVRAYLARIAERLTGIAGVEPFPEWYWHITVAGVGFQVVKRTCEDDVLRQDVSRIAGKARAFFSREEAFEAQLGPVNAFADVVFVEAADGGRFRRLHAGLYEELPEIPRSPVDGAAFLPHVSIARFASQDGLDGLKRALAETRDEGSGPALAIRRVELVKVWLSEEIPELDTIATFALPDGSRQGRYR